MNGHIIVGEGNRCLCGTYDGKLVSCGDILAALDRMENSSPSAADLVMVATVVKTLVKDVEK